MPPVFIPSLVRRAREMGARMVVVHGETIVEPVAPGTNRAAIEAGVDLLAHPGLIRPEEGKLAVAKGVFLEISARKGHSLTNGHVAAAARASGARLVLNTDARAPGDLIKESIARTVALGAGLTPEEYARLRADMAKLAGLEGEVV